MALTIKRDKLDIMFSQYLKLRDKVCQVCGSQGKSLQVSHFWGRAKRSTRYDDENCDLLCFAHHNRFHQYPGEYAEWKLARLGQDRYDMLKIRASRPEKIDRSLIEVDLRIKIQEFSISRNS